MSARDTCFLCRILSQLFMRHFFLSSSDSICIIVISSMTIHLDQHAVRENRNINACLLYQRRRFQKHLGVTTRQKHDVIMRHAVVRDWINFSPPGVLTQCRAHERFHNPPPRECGRRSRTRDLVLGRALTQTAADWFKVFSSEPLELSLTHKVSSTQTMGDSCNQKQTMWRKQNQTPKSHIGSRRNEPVGPLRRMSQ